MIVINHTFVICAYKESDHLEACIESLKNQTIKSKIVITTSTPNEFIENMANKHKLPLFVHNGSGIGADWNFGWSVVDTPYMTIAHQDDIYLPSFAEASVNALMSHSKSLISFTDYDEIKNDKIIKKTTNLKIKQWMSKPVQFFPKRKWARNVSLAFGNYIACPAVSYNMVNLKGFQFSTDYRANLDWDAWYRISQKEGSFHYIKESLMLHRIHEESETSNAIENNIRTTEDYEMYQKYWPNFFAKFLMKFYVKSQNTN